MMQVKSVLSIFWGRKRWPRRKLREVIKKNHGKEFGLYRAKVTRFAGNYREMSRLLRCKADLQEVVVTAEFAKQKVSNADQQPGQGSDEALAANSFSIVKSIVLDDDGFWADLVTTLRIAIPVVKLLRMLDSNKPVLGKVYHRMFLIGEKLSAMQKTCAWVAEAAKRHADRWEYIHSDMHAAAYALDPEFIEAADELDEPTQNGLLRVLEKLSLRDAILSSADPEQAWKTMSTSDSEVVVRIAQVERELALYQSRAGPFSRPSAILNAQKMDPASWWATYGRHLPLLCQYATTILSQVGSSSSAERNWSIFGRIRENRPRLGHVKCDKLVYCHESLALHRKLHDAGYRPDVERWEGIGSDSDSDASSNNDLEVDLGEEELLRLTK